ncbi:MAG: phosphoribosyl-ATP diphosphatase [Sphingopyxis sp.]|nr:phosphoribosyl-ATP diphosphatase [Sphingopyxis sp.]
MTNAHPSALARLEATVRARIAAGEAEASYVASLLAKGHSHIARKLGEEALELVIAAVEGEEPEIVAEATDLVFHLTVLLAARGIGWDAILAELDRRHGTSGHAEKAARTGAGHAD